MKHLRLILVFLPVIILLVLMTQKGKILNRLSDISGSALMHAEGDSVQLNYFSEFDLQLEHEALRGTLVEIGAENCSACRRMKKTLGAIEKLYPGVLDVKIFNVTEAEGLAMGKKFGLVMIPMQVLLNRKGEIVFKHVGYITQEDLTYSIETNLILKNKL